MNRFDILFERPLPPGPSKPAEVKNPSNNPYLKPGVFIGEEPYNQEYNQEWLSRPYHNEPPPILRLVLPSGTQVALPRAALHMQLEYSRYSRGQPEYELHLHLPRDVALRLADEFPGLNRGRGNPVSDYERVMEGPDNPDYGRIRDEHRQLRNLMEANLGRPREPSGEIRGPAPSTGERSFPQQSVWDSIRNRVE